MDWASGTLKSGLAERWDFGECESWDTGEPDRGWPSWLVRRALASQPASLSPARPQSEFWEMNLGKVRSPGQREIPRQRDSRAARDSQGGRDLPGSERFPGREGSPGQRDPRAARDSPGGGPISGYLECKRLGWCLAILWDVGSWVRVRSMTGHRPARGGWRGPEPGRTLDGQR